MLSMSKIAPDVKTQDKKDLDNLFGFEYSGITINSRRIMGVNRNRCLSNFCQLDETFSWTVPESWSLEDAATLLYVYCTCIFAFYINVEMKKGDKILIHIGSDGIGQTAINLVLWAVNDLQSLHQKNVNLLKKHLLVLMIITLEIFEIITTRKCFCNKPMM